MTEKKKPKKEKDPFGWSKLGFTGLILTALEKAGKKKGKKKKKDHLIEKDYW